MNLSKITGITDNTNEFKSGNIFVCIKGEHFDGHSAAEELLSKGAAAVVTERDLGLPNQLIVENTRKHYAELASQFYGNPTKQLKLIAATGTNGKSTVIALIKHILEAQGYKAGSIGTVNYDVGGGKTYEAKLTVPRQNELYRLLREMVDNGVQYCVIEASSQALSQFRFADEVFETAVFTNLTQDHLDWHGTMEQYYLAKRSLFDITRGAVVCVDDKYGEKLYSYISKTYENLPLTTYSAKDYADCYAVNIKTQSAGVSYWLSSQKEQKSFPVKLAMPGEYNIANSIAAVAACMQLGIKIDDAVEALAGFHGVRGRSEVIYSGDFTVMCDYAHTPDAIAKFLSSVKGFTEGRLITVFGAPGERDATKRAAMGEAADKHSDYIIVTSDNPRFEDEKVIIAGVCEGIKNTPYEIHADRNEAIKAAVKQAAEGDIIVLCGKGHETYQVIGDEHLPFDEREIVNKIVKGN